MPRIRFSDTGWSLLRLAMAALFVASGLMKLADPAAFAVAIENYRLLPPASSAALAWFVPWIELVGGAALLAPGWRAAGWWLALGLGAGFTVFSLSAWWRGLDIACGCFGSGSSRTGAAATARAAGLLVVAALGLRREVRP